MDKFFVRYYFLSRNITNPFWSDVFLGLNPFQMAQLALEMGRAAYLPRHWIRDGQMLLEKAFGDRSLASYKIQNIINRFDQQFRGKPHHFAKVFVLAIHAHRTNNLMDKIECLVYLVDFYSSFQSFDAKIQKRILECVKNWKTEGLPIEKYWQKYPQRFVEDLISSKVISAGYAHIAKARTFTIDPKNMKNIYDLVVGYGFSFSHKTILHVRFKDEVLRTVSIDANTCEVKIKKQGI